MYYISTFAVLLLSVAGLHSLRRSPAIVLQDRAHRVGYGMGVEARNDVASMEQVNVFLMDRPINHFDHSQSNEDS